MVYNGFIKVDVRCRTSSKDPLFKGLGLLGNSSTLNSEVSGWTGSKWMVGLQLLPHFLFPFLALS